MSKNLLCASVLVVLAGCYNSGNGSNSSASSGGPSASGATGHSASTSSAAASSNGSSSTAGGSTGSSTASVAATSGASTAASSSSATTAGSSSTTTSGSSSSSGGATCDAPNLACDGGCIDPSGDNLNCGACNHACTAGETCVLSHCITVCNADQLACDAGCIDPGSDNLNCGACGHGCHVGEVCSNSTCQVICQGGFTDCDGGCADLSTDTDNCGVCGHGCGARQVCSNRICQDNCGTGETVCSGECTDTSFDPNNCGACGTQCELPQLDGGCCGDCCGSECDVVRSTDRDATAGRHHVGPILRGNITNPNGSIASYFPDGGVDGHQVSFCSSSSCGLACAPNFADCDQCPDDGCETEIDNDPNNCGSCNSSCLNQLQNYTGYSSVGCTNDACTITCDPGYVDCDHLFTDGCEVNSTNDPLNCGACGAACPPDTNTCLNSACICEGLVCNGVCYGLNDPDHCGTCDSVCASNGLCSPPSSGGNSGTTGGTTGGTGGTTGGGGGAFPDGGTRQVDGGTGYSCGCPGGENNTCDWGDGGYFCTDLNTDTSNCGVCGVVCPANGVCDTGGGGFDGGSGCGCPGNLPTLCGFDAATHDLGACIDTTSDANNCDGCGLKCGPGYVCSDSVCTCPSTAPNLCGLGDGGSECVDLQADPKNCGQCGLTCSAATPACGPSGGVDGGAACTNTVTYDISFSQLVNVENCLSEVYPFPGCTNGGFTWTDLSSGVQPTSIQVSFDRGTLCASTPLSFFLTLNGSPSGSFIDNSEYDCVCEPSAQALTFTFTPTGYLPGALNELTMDTSVCDEGGFVQDGNGNYATVTVTY